MSPACDISKYQGAWQDYPADIVLIKMSGGDAGLYFDPDAATNYTDAKAAGKAVGGYHFVGWTEGAAAEASWFLKAMSPVAQNDVYALDAESGAVAVSASSPAYILAMAEYIHNAIDVWPLVYMSLNTLNSFDWSAVLVNCGLWLADWAVAPTATIPTHATYVMQQYSDGPNYDHDEFFGSVEQFNKYGYQVPAPATPIITPPVTPSVETTPVQTTPIETAPVETPPISPPSEAVTIPVKVTKTTAANIDGILPAGTVVKPTDSSGKLVNTEDFVYDNIGFIQKVVNLFKGRKTYIASALMLLTGIEKYFTGSHTLSQYITTTQGLFGSVGVLGITIRAAIAKLRI
jgi:Glycosyl hydrolases family 25